MKIYWTKSITTEGFAIALNHSELSIQTLTKIVNEDWKATDDSIKCGEGELCSELSHASVTLQKEIIYFLLNYTAPDVN